LISFVVPLSRAAQSKTVSVGVPPFFMSKYEYAVALLETTSDRLVAPALTVKVKLDPVPGAFVPINAWARMQSSGNTVTNNKNATEARNTFITV
jgi:hypothetical protein